MSRGNLEKTITAPVTVIVGYDEELYFDCRPWFYVSYPDAVVVRITEGKVVNFAYYH